MSRDNVFVVQEPLRRNRVTGEFESKFDLTPAVSYGDIKVILPPGGKMISTAPMSAKLKHALRNFGDADYIIPTGDPCAIMAAGAYAAKFNRDRFKVLSWDGRARQYIMVQMDL